MNTAHSLNSSRQLSLVRAAASLSFLSPFLVVGVLVFGLIRQSVHAPATDHSRVSSAEQVCQDLADNGGFAVPASLEQRRSLGQIYAREMLYTYRVAQKNRVRRRSISPAQRPALDISDCANAASYNALAAIYPELVGGDQPLPSRLPCTDCCGDRVSNL